MIAKDNARVRKNLRYIQALTPYQEKSALNKNEGKDRKRGSQIAEHAVFEHLERFARSENALWMFRQFYVGFSLKKIPKRIS